MSEPPEESCRLFIAIPLPEQILKQIADLAGRLRKGFEFTSCRPTWVAPESMHLTLVFLGGVPAARIAPLIETIRPIAGRFGPLKIKPRDLGVFPHWRRPSVLWVGLDEHSGALLKLQSELCARAAPFAEKPPEKHFHPHLTLARFKSGKGVAQAESIVSSHRSFKSEPFQAEAIVLFKSTLHHEGARHERLESFALSG